MRRPTNAANHRSGHQGEFYGTTFGSNEVKSHLGCPVGVGMRRLITVIFNLAVVMAAATVSAKGAEVIALKSGETAEIGNLFWVAACRSLLKGPMTVEILEGPPDVVTASIRPQKIVPHRLNCAKPVEGGVLLLTAAKDIKTRTQAKLVLRVKYPTVDGERQQGHDIDLTIVP